MEYSCSDKSKMLLIGGGFIPQKITQKILDVSGGVNSKIVVCTLASNFPSDSGSESAGGLFAERHGCPNVKTFDFISTEELQKSSSPKTEFLAHMRHAANSEESLDVLDNCDVFFFTGGDQNHILRTLRGTRFEAKLFDFWAQGRILIAGTSAGLPPQSEISITGDFSELPLPGTENETHPSEDVSCPTISLGNVCVEGGFGLLKKTILDQHFLARKRQNRLISVVLDNPDFLGIGVDESTGIYIAGTPGGQAVPEVIGDSGVFYVNAKNSIFEKTFSDKLLSFKNLECGLIFEGTQFPFALTLGSRTEREKL